MNNEFLRHIKNNVFLYIFAVISLAVGIAVGSLYSVGIDAEEGQELGAYISDFWQHYEDKDIEFTGIFLSGLTYNIRYVFLCAVASLSIYTVFAVYLMLGVRGFSLGFTVGFILKTSGLKGFFLLLLSVLPSCIVTLPLYFYMSVMCVRCAVNRHRLRENYRENRKELKSFLIIMAFIFTALVLCSLIDTFLSPVIVKYVF